MKKIYLGIVIAFIVVAAGTGAWLLLRRGNGESVTVCNLVLEQLPAAELATRTVSWQSVICESETFPSRYFVIGRTATIKAGFDLARLDPEKDVSVDEKKRTITLRLPKAKILSLAWSPNRIIIERHSVGAAVLNKSAAEENRRRKLFEEALRRDVRLYQLLDLATLNEGIARYLEPIAARYGWKIIVVSDGHVDFATALDEYLTEHP